MDNNSAQEIETMMSSLMNTVHNDNIIKVVGGMLRVILQTSTVSTTVGHTPPLLMV